MVSLRPSQWAALDADVARRYRDGLLERAREVSTADPRPDAAWADAAVACARRHGIFERDLVVRFALALARAGRDPRDPAQLADAAAVLDDRGRDNDERLDELERGWRLS